jgi:hypothetical protein
MIYPSPIKHKKRKEYPIRSGDSCIIDGERITITRIRTVNNKTTVEYYYPARPMSSHRLAVDLFLSKISY